MLEFTYRKPKMEWPISFIIKYHLLINPTLSKHLIVDWILYFIDDEIYWLYRTKVFVFFVKVPIIYRGKYKEKIRIIVSRFRSVILKPLVVTAYIPFHSSNSAQSSALISRCWFHLLDKTIPNRLRFKFGTEVCDNLLTTLISCDMILALYIICQLWLYRDWLIDCEKLYFAFEEQHLSPVRSFIVFLKHSPRCVIIKLDVVNDLFHINI